MVSEEGKIVARVRVGWIQSVGALQTQYGAGELAVLIVGTAEVITL